jgi:hypothetical protein
LKYFLNKFLSKDFLYENKNGFFNNVEVTTNSYNEPCVKISLDSDNYYTLSYNNQISGKGYNLALENFTNKTISNITTNDHGGTERIGGSGRGYCWEIANVAYTTADVWCIQTSDYLVIASRSHASVRNNPGYIYNLSFVLFKKNGDIIAQSYHDTTETITEDSDYGSLAVITPFIYSNNDMNSNIYKVECYGSGNRFPMYDKLGSTSNEYYYEKPTELSLEESNYILLGRLAIKE